MEPENTTQDHDPLISLERITMDDLTELALMLHEHTEGIITRADDKAQVILTAATLLAAALTLSGEQMITGIDLTQITVQDAASLALTVLLFVSLLVAVYYAVLVSVPILAPRKKKEPPPAQNLYFFGDVAGMGRDQFVEAFLAQTEGHARRAILEQIYSKSVIATAKFARIKQGARFLILALAFWVVKQILQTIM